MLHRYSVRFGAGVGCFFLSCVWLFADAMWDAFNDLIMQCTSHQQPLHVCVCDWWMVRKTNNLVHRKTRSPRVRASESKTVRSLERMRCTLDVLQSMWCATRARHTTKKTPGRGAKPAQRPSRRAASGFWCLFFVARRRGLPWLADKFISATSVWVKVWMVWRGGALWCGDDAGLDDDETTEFSRWVT